MMKTNSPKVLLTLLFSFTMILMMAQDQKNTNMKPFDVGRVAKEKSAKDLRSAFEFMYINASSVNKKDLGACDSEDLESLVIKEKLEATDRDLFMTLSTLRATYLNYPSELTDAISRDDAVSFSIGNFQYLEDAALNAYSSTNNYVDFVKSYTGENIADLSEHDQGIIRGQYDHFKYNYGVEYLVSTRSFMSLACSHEEHSYVKLKELNYPNATWQIRTEISTDCECSLDPQLTKNVDSGSIEYSAEVTGLLTANVISFNTVTNAKVKPKGLACCSKNDISSTSVDDSDTDDSKGYFQVSAFAGLPMGKEKDFYSFTYGAEVAYLFNLTDDLSAGAGVGYNRFTGKDIGGFETEGIGFVPITLIGAYDLSDDFGVQVYGGYSASATEGLDGGANYGLGFNWTPIPGLRIQPEISLTNLGDDGDFNQYRLRVIRSF